MLTPTEVKNIARSLMMKHGLLPTWTFEFDRAKRRLGQCRFRDKTISLSLYFIASEQGTEEQVRDTMLHEIAHALVGPGHGHDAVWKRKAKEIGAKPERCGPALGVEHRYALVCPSCKHQWPRHRRGRATARYVCNRRSCPHRPQLLWTSS